MRTVLRASMVAGVALFGTVGALLSSRRPPFDELGVDELIARLVTTLSAALAASHEEPAQ